MTDSSASRMYEENTKMSDGSVIRKTIAAEWKAAKTVVYKADENLSIFKILK